MASEDPPTDLQTLWDQLDSLWATYLNHLDLYQAAQQQLQKHISAGALSLSQANFQSRGRRYGQDYYDERAVATTRARISTVNGSMKVVVHALQVSKPDLHESISPQVENVDASKDEKVPSSEGEKSNADAQSGLPTPRATPEPAQAGKDGVDHGTAKTGNTSDEPERPLRDAIRQFGILVPAPLRLAQKSFSTAVQSGDAAAQAVNAARGMRDAEVEIRKLRKTIRKRERSDAS